VFYDSNICRNDVELLAEEHLLPVLHIYAIDYPWRTDAALMDAVAATAATADDDDDAAELKHYCSATCIFVVYVTAVATVSNDILQ